MYIYGSHAKNEYISFYKRGQYLIGLSHEENTDGGNCFAGRVSNNSLENANSGYYSEPTRLGNGKYSRDYIVRSISLEIDPSTRVDSYRSVGGKYDDNPSTLKNRVNSCINELKKEQGISITDNSGKSEDKSIESSSSPLAKPPGTGIAPPRSTSTARPPNSQELALLDRQPKVQTADRTKIKNRTNNFLKPFAGGWQTADNQKYYVYPSTKKERQACIIVENGNTQDLQIGVANGNTTGTDINVGTSRLFKTQNANTIALRSPNSESLVPLYASAIEANITPGNLEMMQQVGCMTSFLDVAK